MIQVVASATVRPNSKLDRESVAERDRSSALSATDTTSSADMGTKTVWMIASSHSGASLTVRHMFTKVRGRFTDLSGTIETEGDRLTGGQVTLEINADSIDTNDARRDGHLDTNDFFGSDDNPTITFQATSVTRQRGNEFLVHGDLTMRGITRPVTPEAEYEGGGKTPLGTEIGSWMARRDRSQGLRPDVERAVGSR